MSMIEPMWKCMHSLLFSKPHPVHWPRRMLPGSNSLRFAVSVSVVRFRFRHDPKCQNVVPVQKLDLVDTSPNIDPKNTVVWKLWTVTIPLNEWTEWTELHHASDSKPKPKRLGKSKALHELIFNVPTIVHFMGSETGHQCTIMYLIVTG